MWDTEAYRRFSPPSKSDTALRRINIGEDTCPKIKKIMQNSAKVNGKLTRVQIKSCRLFAVAGFAAAFFMQQMKEVLV